MHKLQNRPMKPATAPKDDKAFDGMVAKIKSGRYMFWCMTIEKVDGARPVVTHNAVNADTSPQLSPALSLCANAINTATSMMHFIGQQAIAPRPEPEAEK